MSHDKQALLKALDQEPWLTLLALADACEEEGERALALGYRLVASFQDYPVRRGTTDCKNPWRWETFPQTLVARRHRPGRGVRKGHFPTAAAAFTAAAETLGAWITRREPRPRPL